MDMPSGLNYRYALRQYLYRQHNRKNHMYGITNYYQRHNDDQCNVTNTASVNEIIVLLQYYTVIMY